jgi:capsular exopolysaccharide synthesis family protein
MELAEYLGTLRRRWLFITALALLGAGIGFVLGLNSPKMYKASSSVFVSTQRGSTTTELVQGSTFTQNLIQSYAKLAKMPSVLGPVITKLNLQTTPERLADAVSADTPLNTVLIEIAVTDESPTQAALIANAVSSSLATTAQALSPKADNGTPAITMQQVEQAQAPNNPFAPDKRFMALTGFALGLAVASAYALGRQVIDTRLRTEQDVQRATEIPVLGTIPGLRRKGGAEVADFRTQKTGVTAESFRKLAANLEFLDPDARVRSVVVTSAVAGEGKSSTAINLALALAERSDRVILVDADLRRPRIAEYCGIDGTLGLTTVLTGRAKLGDVIEPWGPIRVLPSGAVPPNPNQLVTSAMMAATVEALVQQFDIVIFDSAPLLPVADSLALSRLTDGALLVARANSTRRGQLKAAADAVENVKGRVLGVILNRIKLGRDIPRSYGDAALPAAKHAMAPEHEWELGGKADDLSIDGDALRKLV